MFGTAVKPCRESFIFLFLFFILDSAATLGTELQDG